MKKIQCGGCVVAKSEKLKANKKNRESKAKKDTLPRLFEIQISLPETRPMVFRRVLVHDVISLLELHVLIQMVMGWMDYPSFQFQIAGAKFPSIDGIEAKDMEWVFDELQGILLRDVLGDVKEFSYTYDFGDCWRHQIQILRELKSEPYMNYPACIGGENACPPEDCGGPPGFEQLKEDLESQDLEIRQDALASVGGYYNVTSFDPNFINRLLLWGDGIEG